MIALAIPLSVAKNGLRIFVLAMLATRVDRSFLTGKLHHQGGVIYLLIALAGIFLVIWTDAAGRTEIEHAAITRIADKSPDPESPRQEIERIRMLQADSREIAHAAALAMRKTK